MHWTFHTPVNVTTRIDGSDSLFLQPIKNVQFISSILYGRIVTKYTYPGHSFVQYQKF